MDQSLAYCKSLTFRCQVGKRQWALPNHSSRGAGRRGQQWRPRFRRVLQRGGVSRRWHHTDKGQVPWRPWLGASLATCSPYAPLHLLQLATRKKCLLLDHFDKRVFYLFHRLSNKDQHDVEEDFDLEVSRAEHQHDGYYDDDQQPIYGDSSRPPRRWFLPSPQGLFTFF